MHKSIREFLINYPKQVIKFSQTFPVITKAATSLIISVVIFISINKYQIPPSINTLKIGRVGSVLYINPVIQTANPNETLLISLIYDPLVEPNISGTILPSIAKTWSITEQGKHYVLVLRDNIHWPKDNTILTASDVYKTLMTIRDSKQRTAIVKALENITITQPGPFTLDFRLKQPNNNFLELLNIYIAKKTSLKNYSYAQLLEEPDLYSPIGTGPYIIKTRTLQSITLTRNPQYFKGVPALKTLTINFYNSRKELISAYINNAINFFTTTNPTDIKQVLNQPHTKIHTYTLAYYTRVLFFNLLNTKSAVSDTNIRQAIFYAIDKQKLIKDYPGAQVATGPYNKFSWAYLPVSTKSYSLQKAQYFLRLCKQKFKDKCTNLTLTFANTPENRTIVQRIQAELAQIGINLKLKPLSSLEILQQVLPNRDFEILYFGIQSTIDPDQYNLWHSSQIKYPGLNISGLKSKRIDYYLEQGRITPNKLRRQYYYQQFQQELEKYRPVVYLFYPPLYVIAPDNLKIPLSSKYIISEQQIFQDIQKWIFKPSK